MALRTVAALFGTALPVLMFAIAASLGCCVATSVLAGALPMLDMLNVMEVRVRDCRIRVVYVRVCGVGYCVSRGDSCWRETESHRKGNQKPWKWLSACAEG